MRPGLLVATILVLALLTPRGFASATELYSDAWVEALARRPIEAQMPFDRSQTFDVVRNGHSLKISQIFWRLGIDRKKVISMGTEREMNVTYFEWQLSDSYLLSIMVGSHEIPSTLKQGDEWNLPGYGVRVFRIAR